MNRITQNHPEAHEKLTAKLFWKLTSERGYIDAGNVRDYVDATTRSLVTRSRTEQGARHVNGEQVDVNHESYTFLLDERFPEQEQLIKLAKNLANQNQRSVEGATATIEQVSQGRWFDIGAWNIANALVRSHGAGYLEEGLDYDIDLRNGRIKILAGGAVSDGDTVNLEFDQPGISFERRLTQQQPLFYCDLIIEEFNQFSKVWLRRSAFKGYLSVTEFPNQSGEFATYRARATPAGPVTVFKRPEAETLPDHVEGGMPADASSNSSSSSTHSSSSSTIGAESSPTSQSSNSSSSTLHFPSSQSSASSQSSSSSSSSSISSIAEAFSSQSSASSNSSSSSSTAVSQTSSSSSSSISSSSSLSSNSSSSSSVIPDDPKSTRTSSSSEGSL